MTKAIVRRCTACARYIRQASSSTPDSGFMAAIVPDRGYQTGYATRRHPLAGEDAVSLLRTVEAPQRPVADLALARTARGGEREGLRLRAERTGWCFRYGFTGGRAGRRDVRRAAVGRGAHRGQVRAGVPRLRVGTEGRAGGVVLPDRRRADPHPGAGDRAGRADHSGPDAAAPALYEARRCLSCGNCGAIVMEPEPP